MKSEVETVFFIGKGESPAIDKIHLAHLDERWVVGADFSDSEIQRGLSGINGKVVQILGLKAGRCVRLAIQQALRHGASKVIIDLAKIHMDEDDDEVMDGILEERAYALGGLKAWDKYQQYHDRLEVLQHNLWIGVNA